jgi:hypothetical protein
MRISPEEATKLETFLRTKFGNKNITVRGRGSQVSDSVEVLIDGEYIAVIYKDEDEGETSFNLNMAILDIDLDSEKAA